MTTVSSSTLSVPTPIATGADSVTTSNTKAADGALNLLLQDSTFLQSLGSQSSTWVPPTQPQVLSTLWGLINTSGSSQLTKSAVQQAVIAEGGSTSAGDALWKQLSPDNKDSINAGDFATNTYLTTAVTANLTSIQDAVNTQRQQSAGTAGLSNSVLDLFAGGGSGSVLDMFV